LATISLYFGWADGFFGLAAVFFFGDFAGAAAA
jgi:hypothetical protein